MPRYAAVDIGSNSIRMMAAEVNQKSVRVLAEDRQVTRLGESVFRTGLVSEEAMGYLVTTLERMVATYQKLGVDRVRGARHAGRNHLRNRGGAPHPSWRPGKLAAGG